MFNHYLGEGYNITPLLCPIPFHGRWNKYIYQQFWEAERDLPSFSLGSGMQARFCTSRQDGSSVLLGCATFGPSSNIDRTKAQQFNYFIESESYTA